MKEILIHKKEFSIKKIKKTKRLRTNERITSPNVRLISNSGEQIGITNLSGALKRAEEEGLDLVEISPNTNPPVCKILDWGKYKYETMKKEQKQKQKTGEIKNIRLSAKIGEHDLKTKIKQGVKFLEKGYKVKIFLFLKGREITHKEIAEKIMKQFQKEILEITDAEEEKTLEFQGREYSMILKPKK